MLLAFFPTMMMMTFSLDWISIGTLVGTNRVLPVVVEFLADTGSIVFGCCLFVVVVLLTLTLFRHYKSLLQESEYNDARLKSIWTTNASIKLAWMFASLKDWIDRVLGRVMRSRTTTRADDNDDHDDDDDDDDCFDDDDDRSVEDMDWEPTPDVAIVYHTDLATEGDRARACDDVRLEKLKARRVHFLPEEISSTHIIPCDGPSIVARRCVVVRTRKCKKVPVGRSFAATLATITEEERPEDFLEQVVSATHIVPRDGHNIPKMPFDTKTDAHDDDDDHFLAEVHSFHDDDHDHDDCNANPGDTPTNDGNNEKSQVLNNVENIDRPTVSIDHHVILPLRRSTRLAERRLRLQVHNHEQNDTSIHTDDVLSAPVLLGSTFVNGRRRSARQLSRQ